MFEIKIFLKLYIIPGVYRFVNFGHRPWWSFLSKSRKKSVKKFVSKRNNLKKRKKPGVRVKNTIAKKKESVFNKILIRIV